MRRGMFIRWVKTTGIVCAIGFAQSQWCAAAEPAKQDPAAVPEKYVINYPVAQQFCPPVESYFDDVSLAIQQINNHYIRHQLNGGYGLPIVATVGDQHLLHLGSDVCWMRPGTPIHAIANGVVRFSTGPQVKPDEANQSAAAKKNDDKEMPPAAVPANQKPSGGESLHKGFGNIVVIEHHLADGSYMTSIYGHMSQRRLVSAGDIVQAGQVIGFEGKKGIENGFYDPHLHFGIREGRMFAPGTKLLSIPIDGKMYPIKLVNMSDTEVQVEADDAVPTDVKIRVNNHNYDMYVRNDQRFIPAGLLNYLTPRDFPISGYALSTDGWRDPTEFLRQVMADIAPAPFGPIPRVVAAKPR